MEKYLNYFQKKHGVGDLTIALLIVFALENNVLAAAGLLADSGIYGL